MTTQERCKRFFLDLIAYEDLEGIGPVTVAECQETLNEWKKEGSIKPPKGFTAEIYAELWNNEVEIIRANNQPEIILSDPELSFEISENPVPLEVIIEHVEREYPGWKFDRTEARYMSCVMAIFTKEG